MTKKYIITIIALLILGLVGGGYYWWINYYKKSAPSVAEQAVTDIQKTIESINQNVAEGVFAAPTVNPMENAPDVNPYRNANPFSDIKTNPFE